MSRFSGVGARMGLALLVVLAGALGLVYLIVVPSLQTRLVDSRLSQLRRASDGLVRELPADRFRWPDFLDSASANKVLSLLSAASTSLRTEASALGSNLSIVQIRQDFNKNLINVLQTGSSNLTLADTNEEAANSQALSTRQSIAVSALALANQSQQSVLQLLR